MGCNCKLVVSVLSILILVFTIWPTIVSWGNWVVIIAAALILIHAWKCKGCAVDTNASANNKKKK